MALINDPDLLTLSTNAIGSSPNGEVYINPTTKTIQLIATTDWASSDLIPADGLTLQTLYSFLKEQWKSNATFIKYDFPMEAITSEQFEFIKGWKLFNDTHRTYIRNAGWAEKTAAGALAREYMGVITLGNIESNHTAYYAWAGDIAKTNFTYPGPVNEAVQIFGDTAVDATSPLNGNKTSTVLTTYIRSAPEGTEGVNLVGYTYGQQSTTQIGATTVTYQAYRFPLSESVDINITKSDATVAAGVYANVSLTYLTGTDSVNVGGSNYNFSGIKIDGNTSNSGVNAKVDEIYMRVQYLLRQTTDIDTGAGTVYGVLADPIVQFVGSTLKTVRQPNDEGVYILDYNLEDLNNLVFVDDTGAERKFPFYATVNLDFGSNLIADPNSAYWLFYTSVPNGSYPGGNAVIVQDKDNASIQGALHYVALTGTGNMSGTSGSTTSGSNIFTKDGASNWTADALIGDILYVSTGLNTKKYTILDNTTTTITIDGVFEATDSGMDWQLIDKNTIGRIQFVFNYDGETDGGRTAGTDAPVTLVAIGLEDAQFVTATGTITKSSVVSVTATAPLERNYLDPV